MNRNELLEWAKATYHTEADYPWQDENVVLRHKENRKWYGLVMKVGREKLGLTGDGMVDILNVKCEPMMIGSLRSQNGFHPAYHMNKDTWLTIRLDGSVREEQIRQLLDLSYQLTGSGKKSKAVGSDKR